MAGRANSEPPKEGVMRNSRASGLSAAVVVVAFTGVAACAYGVSLLDVTTKGGIGARSAGAPRGVLCEEFDEANITVQLRSKKQTKRK